MLLMTQMRLECVLTKLNLSFLRLHGLLHLPIQKLFLEASLIIQAAQPPYQACSWPGMRFICL